MNKPLRLFLGPDAIKRYGSLLDEYYPGVELYETQQVGEPVKFVRTLGIAQQ